MQFQSDARVTNPASVLGFVYSKNLTAFNGGQFHGWSHAARSHADHLHNLLHALIAASGQRGPAS
jgi:hypothetical protein